MVREVYENELSMRILQRCVTIRHCVKKPQKHGQS